MSEFSRFRNIDSFQCNVCHHFDRFNCCCSEEPYCVMEVERAYQQGRKDQRKEDEELNYHYQTSHECYMQGRADIIDKIVDMYNSNPEIDAFTLIRNLLKEKNNE